MEITKQAIGDSITGLVDAHEAANEIVKFIAEKDLNGMTGDIALVYLATFLLSEVSDRHRIAVLAGAGILLNAIHGIKIESTDVEGAAAAMDKGESEKFAKVAKDLWDDFNENTRK